MRAPRQKPATTESQRGWGEGGAREGGGKGGVSGERARDGTGGSRASERESGGLRRVVLREYKGVECLERPERGCLERLCTREGVISIPGVWGAKSSRIFLPAINNPASRHRAHIDATKVGPREFYRSLPSRERIERSRRKISPQGILSICRSRCTAERQSPFQLSPLGPITRIRTFE